VNALEARRSTSNTTTPGQAVVVKVTTDSTLEFDSTGADAGTGDVVIRMAKMPGLVAGTRFYDVVVDAEGRVTGGSTTPTGSGGGGPDIGMDPVFDSVTANIGDFDELRVQNARFLYPLPIHSGGTGAGESGVEPRYFFAGPADATQASTVLGDPRWRRILESDLPDDISFLKLHGLPSTIAGYGITDAYTKAQVDAIIASVVHDSNLPPGGDATQALMGDRNWHTLSTDMVAETSTHKYFADALARAAIKSVSSNINYDAVTGEIELVPVPEVEQVHVLQSPTQPDHAVSLSYLTTQFAPTGTKREEFITVTSALAGAGSDVTLHWQPRPDQHIRVSWNGLDCAGYFTVSGTLLTLNSAIVLTVGDSLVIDYHS
jgi:hypothetical protein